MNPIEILLDPGVPLAWPVFATLLGLSIGSFANVCIHRLPASQSVVAPRSRCPRCGHALAAWENIPVLSFLILRARCRACREPITWRYPLVEAANGAAYLGLSLQGAPSWRLVATMAFVTALLVLSLIDLEHFILPDVITLPGVALGLLASLLPGSPVEPLQSLGSAVGGYVAFACVALSYEKLRGVEGLGQGDWKMAAMLGAFLGWKALLLTVLLASVVGTLIGIAMLLRGGGAGLRARLPLGTLLGFAGVLVVFTGERVLRWYASLLGV